MDKLMKRRKPRKGELIQIRVTDRFKRLNECRAFAERFDAGPYLIAMALKGDPTLRKAYNSKEPTDDIIQRWLEETKDETNI